MWLVPISHIEQLILKESTNGSDISGILSVFSLLAFQPDG